MMNLPKPAERSREKGFTLIELLIVIAIIGILAAIAIPQFGQYRDRADEAATLADLRGCLSEALAEYAVGELDEGEAFECGNDAETTISFTDGVAELENEPTGFALSGDGRRIVTTE